MRCRHAMPFGAELSAAGARFRLWAPAARQVELGLAMRGSRAELEMSSLADGWFEATVADAPAGTRYAFRIDGGITVPDPASRFNPDDVHRPSMVVDPLAYEWRDAGWTGRPWEDAVFYELHVGAFTAEGSFAAAIERLDYLANLGVTAVELTRLIDAVHSRSLIVFLDAVYNHFRTEGNNHHAYPRQFFNPAPHTRW